MKHGARLANFDYKKIINMIIYLINWLSTWINHFIVISKIYDFNTYYFYYKILYQNQLNTLQKKIVEAAYFVLTFN